MLHDGIGVDQNRDSHGAVPQASAASPLLKTSLAVLVLLLLTAPACAGEMASPPPPASPAPHFDVTTHTPEFFGPGREDPAPRDLDEVLLGWFGPDDPAHPLGGRMWLAASLAVEDANRGGGYEGRPFRLVSSWSKNPWGTGIADLARHVYEYGVWGIVGAPDDASAHLVEQVVTKARIPFLSPVSTDNTTNLTNVPWIFSLAPSDKRLASALAPAIVSRLRHGDLAIVSSADRNARRFTGELLSALEGLQTFPAAHLVFSPGGSDLSVPLQRLSETGPTVVALVAGAEDSARFLIALRYAGLTMPVIGGPAMGDGHFVEAAGPCAIGVVFPLLWHPTIAGDRSAAFAQRFRERFDKEADYSAAFTYDAVRMLIAAVDEAGLNRARIRDRLREISPRPGVSGTIDWDPTGRNQAPVPLGTILDGSVAPITAE